MKSHMTCVVAACLVLIPSLTPFTVAQTSAQTASALPRLVRFGGTVKDLNGNPLTGVVGITFAFYSEQTGGAALWLETQNVTADSNGRYTALLGSTVPEGLPADLFTSEQARWVGVQVSGQAEQPRVLLVSAPYALKAGDAETIGGLPPSAFVLANGSQGAASGVKPVSAPASAGAQKNSALPANPAVTGKGVADFIPMWDSASDIVDSIIFQKTAAIGIGTITPAATLDVNGKAAVRDSLILFPNGTDSTLAISGTPFKIDQTGKITFIAAQTFPGTGTITGITTAAGSGLTGGGTKGALTLKVPAAGITNAMLSDSKITLNSNSAGGLTTPGAMTLGGVYTIGLKPCAANQILQYTGTAWVCVAAAGTGTITGVTAGTDLTGGGTSGNVTLNLNTAALNSAYAQLGVANTFAPQQVIQGNGASAIIGDPGCGSGFSGIGLTSTTLSGCAKYTMIGRVTGDVYVNSISSGFIHFRNGNGGTNQYNDLATIDNAGNLTAAGTVAGTSSSSTGYAVLGSSPNVGVYGASSGASKSGAGKGQAGVWGDTSSPDLGSVGVLGTADNSDAGAFVSNSSFLSPTLFAYNESSASGSLVFETTGPGVLGCYIDIDANLTCDGTIGGVAKADGAARQLSVYAMQSAENWLEDAGSGQLSNGSASIAIDPTFAQTVNTGVEYHVFLTPKGDCEGLYVSDETAQGFEVHELRGGHSAIAFDYRIMAKRAGYENVRLADVTERYQKMQQQQQEWRELMQQRRAARAAATPVAAAMTQGR